MNIETDATDVLIFCGECQVRLRRLRPDLEWIVAPKNEGHSISTFGGGTKLPSDFIVLAGRCDAAAGAKLFAGVECTADDYDGALDKDEWLLSVAKKASDAFLKN